MKHLFLFDVDSVLVEAKGYLRALQDTVAHFSKQMGVGEHPPTEREVRAGEAHGLTSEWDSAPTYIALLLIQRLQQDPDLIPPGRWPDILDFLASRVHTLPRPNYGKLVSRIGKRLQKQGGTTAHAALAELKADLRLLPKAQQRALLPVLDALLGHTHRFEHAPITQHFQHLVIGSDRIEPTYGTPPQFSATSYLQTHDVALLSTEKRKKVQHWIDTNQIGAVVYTARPSLPPDDITTTTRGYSPEAELARTLVGFKTLPLIGLGKLRWLAQQIGADVAALVKPSPVQALAAIGAAWTKQETKSLMAAWALANQQRLMPPLANLPPLTVHVFEDSTGGARAVQHAVTALNQAGLSISYCPYGITPSTGTKWEAMTHLGITTYRCVNAAIDAAEELFATTGRGMANTS